MINSEDPENYLGFVKGNLSAQCHENQNDHHYDYDNHNDENKADHVLLNNIFTDTNILSSSGLSGRPITKTNQSLSVTPRNHDKAKGNNYNHHHVSVTITNNLQTETLTHHPIRTQTENPNHSSTFSVTTTSKPAPEMMKNISKSRPHLQGFFRNNSSPRSLHFSTDYRRQNSHPFDTPSQYQQTGFQVYNQPLYAQTATLGHPISSTVAANAPSQVRYIRPPVSPPASGYEGPLLPPPGLAPLDRAENIAEMNKVTAPTSVEDVTSQLYGVTIASPSPVIPTSSLWSNTTYNLPENDCEDSDSDEESLGSHPNKFPVEIEYHSNKNCMYKRQPTRSGLKVKQVKNSVYDPLTLQHKSKTQHIKYYQKDLVRICRCGQYNQMDGALVQGRTNDCDGYEIHYSQKCKWKAYDDFKTGARVLIRLCKCYKPT